MVAGRCAFVAAAALLWSGASCVKRNPEFIGETDAGTASEPTGGSPTAGTATTDTGECAPVLSSIQLTVFAENCNSADCHSGDAPAGALNLADVDLFEDLLDVRSSTCLDWSRVVAEAPEQSILYAKVAGLATCDVVDPIEHEVLPQPLLDCMAEWIESIDACERCGGTECIDLMGEEANCGECDLTCPSGISCDAGICACPGEAMACDAQCVDVLTDSTNCGGCGNDCLGSPCETGACTCMGGLLPCDGCVDTTIDPLHCGGCDQPCGPGRGCADGACVCGSEPISFAADVQPIFTTHCVSNGCHGGPSPKQDLALDEANAYASTVGVLANECEDGRLRVAPGDPHNSYLMHKLLGMNICDGVQMPSTGGPSGGLESSDIDVVAAWICQGAMNN
jgi:hypothetical protein